MADRELSLEDFKGSEPQKFDFYAFIEKNRLPISLFLIGVILISFGLIMLKKVDLGSSNKIEVLESTTQVQERGEIVVEVAGAVESPGVYKLKNGDRIEDLLIASGGISVNADRSWLDRSLNRAAKLIDGQKIYIKSVDESLADIQDKQSNVLSANKSGESQTISSNFSAAGEGLVNINTASFETLDTLPGIGPVYGQKIIEQRPYSNIEELRTKGVVPASTFEKIKNKITVY